MSGQSGIYEQSNTLAVILGASKFPYSDRISNNRAFAASAKSFANYLVSEKGLAISNSQILDLFDNPGDVIEQDEEITKFLTGNQGAANLIIFYVGHGGFLTDRDYYLALRSTRRGKEHLTGLRIKTLYEAFTANAREMRIYLILDCCFAGEAVMEFQSTELAKYAHEKASGALPESGVSLLVASSKNEVAIAPKGSELTMFSESFLEVLNNGISGKGQKMSLTDVGERTQKEIRRKYPLKGVRPEIHNPLQTEGIVAEVPLFPNPEFQRSEPYFGIDYNTPDGRPIRQQLLALEHQLNHTIPKRTLQETLILATWNLREFGGSTFKGRTNEAMSYIAKIISRFDVVAVEEVCNSKALNDLQKFLSPRWKYLVAADSTSGAGGNMEREIAFVYDSQKIHLGAAGDLSISNRQLLGAPYMAGFELDGFKFSLVTARFISNERTPERIKDVSIVAEQLADQLHSGDWSENIILLGDFNYHSAKNEVASAITSAGFEIPSELRPVTNSSGNKFYDQIAFQVGRGLKANAASVFDFFEVVFREEDESLYRDAMGEPNHVPRAGQPKSKTSNIGRFRTWRTFQMSDHFPMWVEFNIDF